MPEYLAPGVYVEEVSGGARPIAAVGTSTAAFFGCAPKAEAALRKPTFVTDWSAFQRTFVPEDDPDEERPADDAQTEPPEANTLANAVAGFFANGGRRAYIINLGEEADAVTDADMALLDAIDWISMVAAPGFTDDVSVEALMASCEGRSDRFAMIDMAEPGDDITQLATTMAKGGLRPRDAERGIAATYTPWIEVNDPLGAGRVTVPPSGHMCGVYAATDGLRGVHKAPANVPIRGVLGLSQRISTAQQDLLNPVGVNCIRVFSSGIRVWGARTLAADSSEFRYVPVRRLVTMISESIRTGTQWVVFEPNDLTLWKSLRRDIGSFLYGLWRDGALAGAKASDAYFVKCDAETTTQADIDAGRVICTIGIAPVKPAEFVIIRIGQSAAQSSVEEG